MTDKARNYIIEAMGEIQGMIDAEMLKEAREMAQSVKDCVSYPTVGIGAAVFDKKMYDIEDIEELIRQEKRHGR